MKNGLKTGALSGAFFGIGMGLFASLTKGLFNGMITGIILGILFGLVIGIFVSIQSNKFKKDSQKIVGDEKIVFDGVANHFKGAESVGGWLYLTEHELIFQSHEFNIQNHKAIIPTNQIINVKTSLIHGFAPTGLLVTTNDSIEKFVVFNRRKWIKQINNAISIQVQK